MHVFPRLRNFFFKKNTELQKNDEEPEQAYNLWAQQYDDQPDNLMLALDESVFRNLLKNTGLENAIIVDIGCGTGRHWKKIMDRHPGQLVGYDPSQGMLDKLVQKFPEAITHRLTNNFLPGIKDNSCDLIISTLAIAHIENIEEAFQEWNRILKYGGQIIITDYHPAALDKGGDRTFKHESKLISVKNYIHPIEKIKQVAIKLQWQITDMVERKIDDSMKKYYEKNSAISVFNRFKGTPIIYGLRIKKENAII